MRIIDDQLSDLSGTAISEYAATTNSPLPESIHPELGPTLHRLEGAFQQPFAIVDPSRGEVAYAPPESLPCDLFSRLSLCEYVARCGKPEIIEEVAPLFMLAIPLPSTVHHSRLVATATFLNTPLDEQSDVGAAARALGIDEASILQWAGGVRAWDPEIVLRLAELVCDGLAQFAENERLKREMADMSAYLLTTYKETSLLHRLTQNLSISRSYEELCQLAIRWLHEVVPAECVAIHLRGVPDDDIYPNEEGDVRLTLSHGDCPLARDAFDAFIEYLGGDGSQRPIVLDESRTSAADWTYQQIREVVCVPITQGSQTQGWLLAFNHNVLQAPPVAQFGVVEARLLGSVATILGIHDTNNNLYHEQADFFASVVRALTTAIDAKDPYTRGHSDRVARISVCLAKELGCSDDEVNTIYLSGLLHDIGKIGIDDHVLRKPGDLTREEYEHIKQHPELGYNILKGVRQLDEVLPVVLHHHEAWDGSGYPHGLRGEETPKLARIVAVADSFDAMGSDRPYRKGMDTDKLDLILRGGAGKQWDAAAIEAFFAVREEVRKIAASEPEDLSLDVTQWNA